MVTRGRQIYYYPSKISNEDAGHILIGKNEKRRCSHCQYAAAAQSAKIPANRSQKVNLVEFHMPISSHLFRDILLLDIVTCVVGSLLFDGD
jgi:hypothetical protein